MKWPVLLLVSLAAAHPLAASNDHADIAPVEERGTVAAGSELASRATFGWMAKWIELFEAQAKINEYQQQYQQLTAIGEYDRARQVMNELDLYRAKLADLMGQFQHAENQAGATWKGIGKRMVLDADSAE